MKSTKHSGVRKIFIALIAVLLIACMLSVLVACDDNTPNNNGSNGNDQNGSGGGQGGTGTGGTGTGTGTGTGGNGQISDNDSSDGKVSISLSTLDSEQLNQAINGILGYLYAHANNYENAIMMGDYVTDNEVGLFLLLTIFLLNDNGDELSCIFRFFSSEQTASEAFDYVKTDDNIVTINKSVLIEESEEGFYNTVINSTLPQDATAKAQLKFYSNALKKLLNDDCGQSSFSCHGAFNGLYIAALRKQGNIYDIYDCCTAEFFVENREMWANADLTQYTSDSYIKETDGIYYVYLKNKPGFVFEENEDGTGYYVDEFFYETEAPEHLIIPASYNGKPVVGIYEDRIPLDTTTITIPTNLTDFGGAVFFAEGLRIINYQGKIEQWEALKISEYCLRYIEIIHCKDGDIVLKQN